MSIYSQQSGSFSLYHSVANVKLYEAMTCRQDSYSLNYYYILLEQGPSDLYFLFL